MAAPNIALDIRIARPSDAKLVARLCRRAVGPGDYVLRILSETIADRGLFLVWRNGELVGMTNLDRCIDGAGWLSMARTDPNWRRKGVTLFLQRHVIAQARRRGIRALRLWTLSTNTASIKACMKGGFKPVCESAHVSCSIGAKRKPRRIAPLSPRTMSSLKFVLESSYLVKMNGYFAYKWYFVKANRELLEKLLRKGELYWDGESAFILTKPERSFGVPYSSVALLHDQAGPSLRKIKEVAKGFGRIWLGLYLPYDANLLRAANRTGFKRDPWAEHCIVFEKKI